MADSVELKATITSDAGAANKDIKALGDAVKTTGDEAKKAGSAFGEMGERFGKMNPKELAGQIMSITDSLGKVGDVMDAVATNDVAKFKSSMDGAMRGVVAAVALIAPEFAPFLAILTPIITKTLEWALGMEDAAKAARLLADETANLKEKTEQQTDAIDQQMRMEKLRVQDRVAQLGIEVDAINRKSDIEQEAYLKRLTLNNLTEEEIKAHSKFVEDTANELAFKQAEIVAEQQKQELTAIKEHNKTLEETHREHLKTIEEDTKEAAKSDEERIDAADEAAKHQEEIILHLEDVRQQAHDDEQERNQEGQRALDARARKYEQTQREIADASKKTEGQLTADARKGAEERASLAADNARKVISSFGTMAATLTDGSKTMKERLTAVFKQMTEMIAGELSKQIEGAISAGAKQTSAAIGAATSKKAAAAATLPTEVAEAHAGIPFPLGPILAGLALVAFQVLAQKVFQFAEGGPVAGRVPGLGRQDTVPGQLASDEGVLTGTGMNTTIGQVLGLINKGVGGSNGAALAAAGAQNINVNVVMDMQNVPSDGELIRWIMDKINVRVTQKNAPLVASRYHSQNGRAI